MLEGEGHYALTAIKDIKVTEEFLGLGQEVTRCQTRQSRADCVSRRYEEQVLTFVFRPRSAPANSWTVSTV